MEDYISSTQTNDILQKLNIKIVMPPKTKFLDPRLLVDYLVISFTSDRLAGGETCDITLKCGENIFHAHKNVLSRVSEYFRKLFYSEMKEKYQDTVEVNSIDAKIFGLILDFIYTAKITISTGNVLDLLKTSNYLLIKELQEFCCNFILKTLDCDTFVQVWLTVQTNDIGSIKKQCEVYLKENFSNLTDVATINSMDLSTFKRFIAARPKHEKAEERAFQFTVAWVKHDLEERKHLFPQLFGLINLKIMDQEFFSNGVAFQDLVQESHECLQKVTKNIKYLLGPHPLRSILVINENSTTVKMLDTKEGMEKEIKKRNEERLQSSFVVYKNYLYMVGGLLDGKLTNSVVRLDLTCKCKGWEIQPSLEDKRSEAGVAVVGDLLFVFGGYGVDDKSKSWLVPEKLKLDDKESKWVEMKNCKKISRGLVSCQDTLYALHYVEITCERYDPVTEISTMLHKPPVGCVKVVAKDEELYVIRKADENLSLAKYDPETGESHDVSDIVDVGKFRDACAAHGQIVVSYERSGTQTACISAYNFDAKEWNLIIESEDLSNYWKLVPYQNNPFE